MFLFDTILYDVLFPFYTKRFRKEDELLRVSFALIIASEFAKLGGIADIFWIVLTVAWRLQCIIQGGKSTLHQSVPVPEALRGWSLNPYQGKRGCVWDWVPLHLMTYTSNGNWLLTKNQELRQRGGISSAHPTQSCAVMNLDRAEWGIALIPTFSPFYTLSEGVIGKATAHWCVLRRKRISCCTHRVCGWFLPPGTVENPNEK